MSYDKDFLSLVDSMSVISPKVVIEKRDDSVFISRSDVGGSIVYEIIAGKDKFDFDGDNIAFLNFKNFYGLYSCYDSPELIRNGNKLTIKKGSAKINYVLSNPESFNNDMEIGFENPNLKFTIQEHDLSEIKKMITQLEEKPESLTVTITNTDTKINFKVSDKGHDNSFEREFDGENIAGKDSTMSMSTMVFKALPKGTYNVYTNDNLCKVERVLNGITLNVYTARKR